MASSKDLAYFATMLHIITIWILCLGGLEICYNIVLARLLTEVWKDSDTLRPNRGKSYKNSDNYESGNGCEQSQQFTLII